MCSWTLFNLWNLPRLSANQAPCTLEIGFGMGHALLSMAEQEPESNFLGVDVHKAGIAAVVAQAQAKGLKNVRCYEGDAVELLAHRTKKAVFHRIHIFFPDPWPKVRHRKRRLIQREFVDLLQHHLEPKGKIYVPRTMRIMRNIYARFLKAHQDGFLILSPGFLPRRSTELERRG